MTGGRGRRLIALAFAALLAACGPEQLAGGARARPAVVPQQAASAAQAARATTATTVPPVPPIAAHVPAPPVDAPVAVPAPAPVTVPPAAVPQALPVTLPPSTGRGVNVTHLANLQYAPRHGATGPAGTDLEPVTIAGRDYVIAGTYRNGLQVVDVGDPARPRVVAVWDCAVAQGDVQVFRRGNATFATYTADDIRSETRLDSGCYRDLDVRGTSPYGTFIVELTNPAAPRRVSFVPLAEGSHNQTVHPNGRYLYNSNGDRTSTGLEVIDISDLARPRVVAVVDLGAGGGSHDLTFNADGSRAYSAALDRTVVLDTTNPAQPAVVGTIVDPTINVHHQADPVTVQDGRGGSRTFLIVSDELLGAAGNGACPGGGLHVFDVTGARERAPVKVGYFAIPEVRPAVENLRCTSHVFRIYPEHRLLTVGWYSAGVRVVDISALAGNSVGLPLDSGMREIAHYEFPDSDVWAAKALRINPDRSFVLFGNDFTRGLDVFLVRPPARTSGS